MRLIRPTVAASFVAAAVLVATASGFAATRRAPSDTPAFLRYYRMHDDSVITELSQAPVAAWSPAQQLRRSALLAELGRYRDRGEFPHNYDFPNQLVPYFVDGKTGALCAVANLLHFTRRDDVVERVARANNHVWVRELASDTSFRAWLDENGLTLEDAIRIQVPSVRSGPTAPQVGAMAAASLAALGIVSGVTITSLWNATGNSDGHIGKVSSIGMTTGVIAATIGALMVQSPPARQAGVYTLGAGLTSVALSARSMHNHSTFLAAQEAEKSRALAQVSVAPVVSVGSGGGAGVLLSLKF